MFQKKTPLLIKGFHSKNPGMFLNIAKIPFKNFEKWQLINISTASTVSINQRSPVRSASHICGCKIDVLAYSQAGIVCGWKRMLCAKMRKAILCPQWNISQMTEWFKPVQLNEYLLRTYYVQDTVSGIAGDTKVKTQSLYKVLNS